MDKKVRVILLDDAEIKYNFLLQRNDKQSRILLNSIERAKIRLFINPLCGNRIRKELVPKEYKRYDNLYRIELSTFWRMLYTIKGNEVEIIAFVLAIVDHKDYNKKFRYE